MCPTTLSSSTRSVWPTAPRRPRAICLLDCTQTPRDRNGDYLATVEDTSIVNAKLMIWDG